MSPQSKDAKQTKGKKTVIHKKDEKYVFDSDFPSSCVNELTENLERENYSPFPFPTERLSTRRLIHRKQL